MISSLERPQDQQMPSKRSQGTEPNITSVWRVQVKAHTNASAYCILSSSKVGRKQIWRLLIQKLNIKGVSVLFVLFWSDSLRRRKQEPSGTEKKESRDEKRDRSMQQLRRILHSPEIDKLLVTARSIAIGIHRPRKRDAHYNAKYKRKKSGTSSSDQEWRYHSKPVKSNQSQEREHPICAHWLE